MWPIFTNSVRLFAKGKLFRDPYMVLRQWLIGFAVALLTLIVLRAIGLPLWLAIGLPSLCVGLLQPYLFRDLKYY